MADDAVNRGRACYVRMMSGDTRDLCSRLDEAIGAALADGLDAQPDARAVGAHVEDRVAEAWRQVVSSLGGDAPERGGRRTIYDLALRWQGLEVWVDLRTKDEAPGRYADGGVCSLWDLLRMLSDEPSPLFLVVEVSYVQRARAFELRSVTSLPIHTIPIESVRIENLGTGQIRIDGTLRELAARVDWSTTREPFLRELVELGRQHYQRVIDVAQARRDALAGFAAGDFAKPLPARPPSAKRGAQG